jgi:hypothetical protein
LGVLDWGFEPRATLQQPGALSTGPCPTPFLCTSSAIRFDTAEDYRQKQKFACPFWLKIL